MEYKHSGNLIFKYGPMNSAKTVNLLTKAYELNARNNNVILLKPAIDTRTASKCIKSRIEGVKSRPCVRVNKEDNLITIIEKEINQVTNGHRIWVLVDEAQFLDPKQIDQLATIVDTYGLTVLCYGIRTDFRTTVFPGAMRLFEIADSIEEISSTCDCGRNNIVNARMDKDGRVVTEGSQVELGAEEKYITLCRKCYYKRINK